MALTLEQQRMRAKHIADAKAIHEKADAESRSLTDEEKRSFYDHIENADKITRGDMLDKWQGEMDRPNERETSPNAIYRHDGERRTVNIGGNEFRAYGFDEKLSDDNPRDLQPFSIGKVIRGLWGNSDNRWRDAEVEQRTLQESLDTKGGYTVPVAYSNRLIDLARAKSVVLRAGAQTIPLTTEYTRFARVTADPTAAWYAENAPITESEPVFGAFTLKAHTLAMLISVSIEVMEDSPNFPREIERIMAETMALAVDNGALNGIDVGQPQGILQDSDVTTVAAGATSLSVEDLITAAGTLWQANESPTAILMHPRSYEDLVRLKSGDGEYILERAPRAVRDLPMLWSTQMPTNAGSGANESPVVMGDFQYAYWGIRSRLLIESSRTAGSAFDNKQVLIRAILRSDFGISRSSAFVKITGLSAS